jgi:peptidoglycan/LPS O-acetylase OafA/YrhL
MKRFHHLDTIRFALALYIVFGHSVGWVYFAKSGGLAVDFFFILSGFVLAQSIIQRGTGWSSFTSKRVARLWPVNVISLLAVIVIACEHVDPAAWLSHLFLLQNSGLYKELTLNVPSWSISAEILTGVLVLWPIVAFRSKLGAIALVIGGFALLRTVQVPFEHMHMQMVGPLSAGLIRCVIGCALGYLAYELYRQFSASSLPVGSAAIIQAFSICVIFFMLGTDMNNDAKIAAVLFCAFAIFSLATFNSPITMALSHPLLALLGNLSFSIYMWHFPVLLLFRRSGLLSSDTESLALLQQYDRGVVLALATYLAATLGVAYFSYRLIEQPSQSAFTRLMHPNAAGTAKVAPPLPSAE